jgi:hypothetical protein
MTAQMELPRISIKTEVKKAEARPFVGRIVADALQPNKFYDPNATDQSKQKPYQWVLAVQPLKSADGQRGFQIGGKTGAFWEYVPITNDELQGDIKDQTKFGRHFNSFKAVFGSDEDRAIGRGEYTDEVAWFKRDRIQYGTNRETGEAIEGSVLLAVRGLTPEEMVEYGLAAGAAPAATSYTSEELQTLAAALDGKDRNALQKTAYAAKLGNKLAQGVGKGNGPAIVALIEGEYGSFDGDVFRASA